MLFKEGFALLFSEFLPPNVAEMGVAPKGRLIVYQVQFTMMVPLRKCIKRVFDHPNTHPAPHVSLNVRVG